MVRAPWERSTFFSFIGDRAHDPLGKVKFFQFLRGPSPMTPSGRSSFFSFKGDQVHMVLGKGEVFSVFKEGS